MQTCDFQPWLSPWSQTTTYTHGTSILAAHLLLGIFKIPVN